MKSVAIIDYGMGNIRSVQKACEYLGFAARLIQKPEEMQHFGHAILPGVGAFKDAMQALEDTGFAAEIKKYVEAGSPILGICLGMQLFFESSTEGEQEGPGQSLTVQQLERQPGLGLFPGQVTRFPTTLEVKIPHIGWNEVIARPCRLFADLPENFSTYFVHSYQVDPYQHKLLNTPFIAGISRHGQDFVAAVEKNNLMATQFHPEKSGTIGLKILQNFLQF
jgi:glutamine amidotransferase